MVLKMLQQKETQLDKFKHTPESIVAASVKTVSGMISYPSASANTS